MTEIRMIENEALLDKAILEVQKVMAELAKLHQTTGDAFHEAQIKYGELLAHKVMMGVAKRF